MKKFLAVAMVVMVLTCLMAVPGFGADKLIVKDSTGANTVFSVSDTGEVFAGGTDVNNAFQLQVMGHTGGTSHVQLVTNQTNSKISLIASSSTDVAPRFQAIGPQDPSTPGWVLFDFGSSLFNLPTATFKIRHVNMTGVQDMITVVGRNTISFPHGNVGIGTTTPQYLLDVNGQIRVQTTVYSSSRQLKDNIVDLKSTEAMAALEELNPVRYNYKNSPDVPHIGFIAEDVPNLVAQKKRDSIDPMDIVAVLTKVVQEQNKTIAELSEKLNKLEAQVTRIKSRDMLGSVDPSLISGK